MATPKRVRVRVRPWHNGRFYVVDERGNPVGRVKGMNQEARAMVQALWPENPNRLKVLERCELTEAQRSDSNIFEWMTVPRFLAMGFSLPEMAEARKKTVTRIKGRRESKALRQSAD